MLCPVNVLEVLEFPPMVASRNHYFRYFLFLDSLRHALNLYFPKYFLWRMWCHLIAFPMLELILLKKKLLEKLSHYWIEYHADIFHKRVSFGEFLPSLENLNLLLELKIITRIIHAQYDLLTRFDLKAHFRVDIEFAIYFGLSDIFRSDNNKLPLYCLDTNFINCLNRPDFFLAGRDSYFVHAWLQRCLFKSKDFIILSNLRKILSYDRARFRAQQKWLSCTTLIVRDKPIFFVIF